MKRDNIFGCIILVIILFIAFFSFKTNIYAANFNYSDFNWQELLEQNKDFWTSTCEGKKDCVDRVLETKEKYYITLYKLLAEYQRKGYYIDDNIVNATVFYGLTPDSFSDPNGESNNPYFIDEDPNTISKYIADIDNQSDAKSYFDREADSLKTLLNNFIGYTTSCYGVSANGPKKNENNEVYCDNGLTLYKGKCVELLETYKGTFFDSLGLSFFGNGNNEKCDEKLKETGYSESIVEVSKQQEVNEEFFYQFLESSKYFDKKRHLQGYFSVVLQYTGYKTMTEFYLNTSEEEQKKYEKYIVDARKSIIKGIKSVLEMHGEYSDVSKKFKSVCNSNTTYWWPIGGSEINESDGKKTAIGEPTSTTVTSGYGTREGNDIVSSDHRGIDIGGDVGVTSIIAVQNGTVVMGAEGGTGSCVEGDKNCGGGYGNYIIIQHTDGNYTLYAHMATGSVTVNQGDTVSQGQVIGYVGSTGSSTGGHLHFEVRVGGNDSNSTQDPLNYINSSGARGSSSCSSGSMDQLTEWLSVLEGGGQYKCDDNHYKVVDVGDHVKTFGHGITVEYNGDVIRQFGLDPSNLNYGSCVEVSVADEIYQTVIKKHMDDMEQRCSANGITGLNENQLGALTSLSFNGIEPFSNFVNAYKSYGSTETLCTNWWQQYHLHDGNGRYYEGLAKRRKAECDLFVNGRYNMNVYD